MRYRLAALALDESAPAESGGASGTEGLPAGMPSKPPPPPSWGPPPYEAGATPWCATVALVWVYTFWVARPTSPRITTRHAPMIATMIAYSRMAWPRSSRRTGLERLRTGGSDSA